MTKREAIRECKRLWKEIEKSGLGKYDFLDSPAGTKWVDKNYKLDCPLCEYALSNSGKHSKNCVRDCPLYLQYDMGCDDLQYEDAPGNRFFFGAVRRLKE